MRDQHDDQRFREFASALLPEIQSDDQILRSIAEQFSSGPSIAKQAGGWLLEKISRLKLGLAGPTDFEMFESLELLSVGIQGKLCLWKALEAAMDSDTRLGKYDFEKLRTRAAAQYEQAEAQRLALAQCVGDNFLKNRAWTSSD